MSLYATILEGEETVVHEVKKSRSSWVHVARGKVLVNGRELVAGDAAAFDENSKITLSAKGNASEVLVFDLP